MERTEMAPKANTIKKQSWSKRCLDSVSSFIHSFLSQSVIHGFFYLSLNFVHILEKVFWLVLVLVCMFFSGQCGLQSYMRFLHKSTVVTIEKDHYYWNTSLPSLTICPMERLSAKLLNNYCRENNISGTEKTEFSDFLESLANSSYINFGDIKEYDSIDPLLERLQIKPKDYMMLIYNLTEDLTQNQATRVHNINNLDYIRTLQTLTEYGICYTTNNFIAPKLTPRWLLLGLPVKEDPFVFNTKVHDVRYANLFDGDMTYSFIGFNTSITIFLHSPYESMNIARNLRYTLEAYEFEAFSIEIITARDFQEDTTISQRGCRFESESNLTHFKIYTKGICLQECRLDLANQLCGCIPHFYPNDISRPKKVCDYKTLKKCFPNKEELFLEFRQVVSRNQGVKTHKCSCLQNCVDSNVIVEKLQVLTGTKNLLGSIGGLMIMKKYPLIRFNRQILFTFEDLLVSIGGTAGFFTGLSFLGLVEIVYFFTIRLFWFILGYP